MIPENLREILYPLGFLSAVAFGARVLWQWVASEIKGESVVPRQFWTITIFANFLAFLHSIIQYQYHVALITTCNGILAWRNLNLMKPVSKQISFIATVTILLLGVTITTLLFALQGGDSWFRIPIQTVFAGGPQHIPEIWHYIGFFGIILFSSRFWIQWWSSECHKKSVLNAPFWLVSLAGGFISVSYFFYIHDLVNGIGPLLGTIPYMRNLMLIYKTNSRSQ